jgi:hypothetical protein
MVSVLLYHLNNVYCFRNLQRHGSIIVVLFKMIRDSYHMYRQEKLDGMLISNEEYSLVCEPTQNLNAIGAEDAAGS